MKINISVLRQQTQFGCLATCYAMAKDYIFGSRGFTKETESLLTKEAFAIKTGFNEHYYLKKLSDAGCEIKVFLETPYVFEEYEKVNSELGGNIQLEHRLIGIDDFKSLIDEGYIVVTVIDLWFIDMMVHFAHYVIVNGYDDSSISIIDPKYGKEIIFSNKRMQDAVDSIKYRLKHSPLIFAIRK